MSGRSTPEGPAPEEGGTTSASSSPSAAVDDVDTSVDLSTVSSIVAQPLYGVRAAQLDIGSYIHNKRIKLRHQFQQQTQAASPMNLSPLTGTLPQHSTSSSALPPPPSPSSSSLFAGLVFWVNGLTSPPAHQLLPLIYQHCGSVENVLVPLVTHCVADHVPTTKVREWKEKSKRKRWIIQARWVVDSVRERRRLPEHDYLVEELRERGVVSVRGMLLKDNRRTPSVDGGEDQATSTSGSQRRAEHPSASINAATTSHPSLSTAVREPPPPSRPVHADDAPSVPPSPSVSVQPESVAAAVDLVSNPPVGPLSFRSLASRSSPSMPPPPPPPLPNYLSQLLSPAPYYSDQELSRRASRVLTHTTVSSASALPPLPPLPPATHPYAPPPHRPPILTGRPTLASPSSTLAIQATSTSTSTASAAPALFVFPAPPAPPAQSTSPLSPPHATSPASAPPATASSPSSSATAPQSVLLPAHMTGPSGVLSGHRLSGRSTLNDPHFVKTFFAASRLHFIGSWRRLFQGLIPSLLSIPSRVPASSYASPSATSPTYILHCDLDCFFASIAQRDNPALKGKPVAVCHARAADPDSSADAAFGSGLSSSSISSCNYLARSFGLHAEMSIGRARRLCPELVLVPYEFTKYADASEAIYRIFFSVTHRIQAVSLDECYMELPGAWREGEVEEVVKDVRRRVEAATGVQVSIGVGHSLLLARLATKAAKPDNFHFLTASSPLALQTYMAGLSVSEIPGIGWAGQQRLLTDLNVSTCGQLQAVSRDKLQSMFGPKYGLTIFDSCRGIDHRPLMPVGHTDGRSSTQQSIAVNINYGIRFEREDHVRTFLHDVASELLDRLASTHLTAQLLSMKLMVRHPKAPIEPPRKFLGHGVCETRNKSRSIEGRAIGEGGASEVERERLTAMVLDLWDKLRVEFKIKIEDLRGVGLQFNRLKPTTGSSAKGSPFSAWKVSTAVASVEGKAEEKVEAKAAQGPDDGWMVDEEVEMGEEENEWKEDGMEEDMEDVDDSAMGDSATAPPQAQTVTPSPHRPDVSSETSRSDVAKHPTAEAPAPPSTPAGSTPSSAAAPLSVHVPSTTVSVASPLFAMPSSLLLSSSFPSAGSLGTATVKLSMDQLLHVLNAFNQQQTSGRCEAALNPRPAFLAPPSSPPPPSTVTSSVSASSALSASLPASSAVPLSSSSPAPTLDEVVAQLAADKERAFLQSLPAFTSLDRSVISALSIDLRQELASAYKKKRAMEKEKEEAARPPPQRVMPLTAAVPQPSASASSTAGARSARPAVASSSSASPVTFEQLDPTTLAELPADIREEVEREFRRGQRTATAATRSRANGAAASSRAARGGKKASKRKAMERAPAAVSTAPPHRSGLPGVSIVSHFTAVEHERRAERERPPKTSPPPREADAQVIILDDLPTRRPRRVSSRAVVMQPDDSRSSQQLQLEADEKYGEADQERWSTSPSGRQRSVREEKEAEHRRREALQERVETLHRRTVDARAASTLMSSTATRVASSLLGKHPPPSTSSSSAIRTPDISNGALLLETLRGAESTFLSSSSVLPHFSRWLHALRRSSPHRHPAPLSLHSCCRHTQGAAPCSPHCFCSASSAHQSLSRLLLAQLRLKNVECVAAFIKAMRETLKQENSSHATPPPDSPTSASGLCVCFSCSVRHLVENVEGQVVGEYGAALKPRGRSRADSMAMNLTSM